MHNGSWVSFCVGQWVTDCDPLFTLMPPPQGAFWNSAIRPSVCPMAQLPRLAACSLATAGHQRCADCGPVRGRTQIRVRPRFLGRHGRRSASVRDFWIELPLAGAYRLAVPGAIPCSILLYSPQIGQGDDFRPCREAKYCDEHVCQSVCLSVCFLSVLKNVPETIDSNVTKLPCFGPPLAALRYVMYFRFCG